jgi:hypothetical protein
VSATAATSIGSRRSPLRPELSDDAGLL